MQSKPSFGKAHIEQAQVHTGQISVWCFRLDLCSPITPRNPHYNGDWPNAELTRKTTCLHRRVAHKLQQFVNRTFAKPASLNSHYQFLTNDGFGSTVHLPLHFLYRLTLCAALRNAASNPRRLSAFGRLFAEGLPIAIHAAFGVPSARSGPITSPTAPALAGVSHPPTYVPSCAAGRFGARRTRVVLPLAWKLRLPTSVMTQ